MGGLYLYRAGVELLRGSCGASADGICGAFMRTQVLLEYGANPTLVALKLALQKAGRTHIYLVGIEKGKRMADIKEPPEKAPPGLGPAGCVSTGALPTRRCADCLLPVHASDSHGLPSAAWCRRGKSARTRWRLSACCCSTPAPCGARNFPCARRPPFISAQQSVALSPSARRSASAWHRPSGGLRKQRGPQAMAASCHERSAGAARGAG